MTGALRSGSVLSGETKMVLPDTCIVMMASFFVSSLAWAAARDSPSAATRRDRGSIGEMSLDCLGFYPMYNAR